MHRPSRWSAALAASALAITLTACGGADDPPATTPDPTDTMTVEEPTTEEPTTQDTATDEATTEEPTDATDDATDATDAADDETGTTGTDIDGELTEPGTELALGETAVINHASLADPTDSYYRYLKVAATVDEVVPADQSLLDNVQLSTPLEDEVVHMVWVDLEILETDGEHEREDFYPTFGAQHADGSTAYTIWFDGRAIGECASEDYPSLEPGSTARTCFIALAEPGKELGAILWGGDDNADGEGDWENNPYYEDPVIWTL